MDTNAWLVTNVSRQSAACLLQWKMSRGANFMMQWNECFPRHVVSKSRQVKEVGLCGDPETAPAVFSVCAGVEARVVLALGERQDSVPVVQVALQRIGRIVAAERTSN